MELANPVYWIAVLLVANRLAADSDQLDLERLDLCHAPARQFPAREPQSDFQRQRKLAVVQ